MPPREARQGCILGVDIGGTFTDFVLLDQASGRVMTGKVLTRTDDLAAGVLDGVRDLLARYAITGSAVRKVVHGTTLATNALIERRGARTALVVTAGFRDILELARESRYDIFDIDLTVPAPLVPRRLVFEVTERLGADGAVVAPLAADEIPCHRERVEGRRCDRGRGLPAAPAFAIPITSARWRRRCTGSRRSLRSRCPPT
jgi:N-methylhydantoinase A/oxoprolinase/acetone carboxylase beta subunit